MKVGNFRQKANWFTVGFVFGCIFIITILLFAKVKAEEKAQELSYMSGDFSYYIDTH